MARHLAKIIQPLKNYLNARFMKQRRLDKSVNMAEITQLPAPLYIAFLRGEALLRQNIFTHLETKKISDPCDMSYAWQQLIDSSFCISEIVEKSGAVQFFHLDNSHSSYQQQCYRVYCIILWDVAQHNIILSQQLTKGLIDHYLPTLYPKQAKEKTSEQLKKNITLLLYKHWQVKANIKESFITTKTDVEFSLIAKIPNHQSLTLITHSGKRLNITRQQSYKKLLKQLQQQVPPMPASLV